MHSSKNVNVDILRNLLRRRPSSSWLRTSLGSTPIPLRRVYARRLTYIRVCCIEREVRKSQHRLRNPPPSISWGSDVFLLTEHSEHLLWCFSVDTALLLKHLGELSSRDLGIRRVTESRQKLWERSRAAQGDLSYVTELHDFRSKLSVVYGRSSRSKRDSSRFPSSPTLASIALAAKDCSWA